MLKIKLFTFNVFSENTIIIWDDKSGDAAIVDPGTSSSTEENELLSFISSKDLRIKYLINTHCHIDHILGCSFVKEKFNPVYYAPELDLPLLDNAQHQAQMFDLDIDQPPIPDKLITEQTEIMIGESKLQFLFTPGHTPGEFCIYIGEEKICVTGDVLFKESIGRTDLWGGNYETLLNSIHEKLFLLPDDVIIYPGHGEPSTIGYEKQNNPFLV